MSTVAQYLIHLQVYDDKNRLVDCGYWKTSSGGGIDSEEAYSREQYGLPRIALGGQRTKDPITITRTFYNDRDADVVALLEGRAGRGRCIHTRVKLDADANVIGRRPPDTGVVKSCKPSDANVEGSELDTYTVEIGTDTP